MKIIDKTAVADYHSRVPEGAKLLTIQEVCELLKVSRSYIYWLTHQKKIPYIKMHGHLRFRQSAIDNWLQEREVQIGSKKT